jgi:hypothetical protein
MPEVASHAMKAFSQALTVATTWHIPCLHEVAFLLHAALLVLVLDALWSLSFSAFTKDKHATRGLLFHFLSDPLYYR